jgi:hypothetical protein
MPVDVSAAGWVLATSSSSQAYQRPAQDKVAYLHDGSLLVGYFNGSRGVIDQVKNPSTSPSVQQVQTISGDQVTLYTQPGSSSTDIWIQVGAELVGSAPLEQIQHGTYDGSSFIWDAATAIPGTVSPGRQDPSVTWTGKWLIAAWWDDTNLANADNVFMNWTADRTGKAGWLSSAIHMTTTNQNITQPNIRHSARLGATVLVYGTHFRDLYRVLPDGRHDPSLANWTAETMVDPGYDDSEAGFGGPQVAIDESTGKIHVFRAVLNAGSPTWHGVTYWLGTPDAVPMVTGSVTWNPRLIIDAAASPDPVDIAGAVDSTGKVYVFWVTSASSGAIKYATLTSPYTSASPASTLATTGTQPRYPHIPAQAPLSRGYVPVLYQTGGGSPYSIVLDTTILTTVGCAGPTLFTSYFNWYDKASPGMFNDNIHLLNPGTSVSTGCVTIAGHGFVPFSVAPGHGSYVSFPTGTIGGPVVVTVNSGPAVLASQRVQYYSSFNEVWAESAAQAATTSYMNWYDKASPGMFNDNIHLLNPGATSANVTVSLPGATSQTVTVAAGAGSFVTFPAGSIGGPVKVTVNSGPAVLASQRVQYYSTFNEVWAESAAQAATTSYMNWYDKASPGMFNDNIHLLNPGSTSATVTVSLPGATSQTVTVAAGAEVYVTFPAGSIGGPVKVSSSQPLLASQRVQYYSTFNEVPAAGA